MVDSLPKQPKVFAQHRFNLLVCIYMCEADEYLLPRFYESKLGVYLRNVPDSKMIEVCAGSTSKKHSLCGDRLLLNAEEEYEKLSMKTYMMIDYLVANFRFKHILKVDITTGTIKFDPSTDAPHKNVDVDRFIQALGNVNYYTDYNGYALLRGAGKIDAEKWARKKGGAIDYNKVFGDGEMPPYFSGKIYLLSETFAKYISEIGQSMAREHIDYFMGSEDLMIGRLYQRFLRKSQGQYT